MPTATMTVWSTRSIAMIQTRMYRGLSSSFPTQMGMVLATGTLLESVPNTIILAPILAPIAHDIGVDPFHFAVVFLIGDAIGFITPPYGLNLYVASGITGLPYLRIVRQVLPFLFSLLVVWVIIALVPQLSTWLIGFAGLGAS